MDPGRHAGLSSTLAGMPLLWCISGHTAKADNISWVTSRSTSQELRALARLLVLLIQHNSYQVPIPVFDYTSKQMLLAKAYNPWQTALLVSGFVETKASTTQRIHDDKLY